MSKFHLVGCEHLIQEFLQEQAHKETMQDMHVQVPNPPNLSYEDFPQESEPLPDTVHTLDDQEADCTSDKDALFAENLHVELLWESVDGMSNGQEVSHGAEPMCNDDSLPNTVNISVKVEEDEHLDRTSDLSVSPLKSLVTIADSRSVKEQMEANVCSIESMNDTLVQPGIDSAVCSFCQKDCVDQAQLMIHLLVHTDSKRHVCKYCLKGFTTRGNLTQHVRTHTREKPYGCCQCDKSFARKADLDRHVLIHQRSQSGSKTYCCESCGKNYTQACQLYKHRLHCSSSK